MEITLNVEPTTPDDMAAFAAEYTEWNAAVEAGFPMPEEGKEKPNVDLCDVVRQHDEEEEWGKYNWGQDLPDIEQ